METWQGIPVKGEPGSKPAGGNIPHIQNSAYYDANGDLKIVSVPYGFPDPPPELQAEGYHQSFTGTAYPTAEFGGDGICTKAGTVGPDHDGVIQYYKVGDMTGKPSGTNSPAGALARLQSAALAFAATGGK